MDWKVIWADNAEEEFDGIFNFLLASFNDAISMSFLDLYEETIKRVKTNPNSFLLINSENNIRSVLIHKHVTMFYSVNNDIRII
jgi:plasmid stabilization system protein ParE